MLFKNIVLRTTESINIHKVFIILYLNLICYFVQLTVIRK